MWGWEAVKCYDVSLRSKWSRVWCWEPNIRTERTINMESKLLKLPFSSFFQGLTLLNVEMQEFDWIVLSL